MYPAEVLEHSKQPRHVGALEDATHQARCTNPLCGDRITVWARVTDGKLEAVQFEAKGCAIAKASGSMMTEAATGEAVQEALQLGEALKQAVGDSEVELGPLEPLRAVAGFPGRRRCATLPWEALAKALSEGG